MQDVGDLLFISKNLLLLRLRNKYVNMMEKAVVATIKKNTRLSHVLF